MACLNCLSFWIAGFKCCCEDGERVVADEVVESAERVLCVNWFEMHGCIFYGSLYKPGVLAR